MFIALFNSFLFQLITAAFTNFTLVAEAQVVKATPSVIQSFRVTTLTVNWDHLNITGDRLVVSGIEIFLKPPLVANLLRDELNNFFQRFDVPL